MKTVVDELAPLKDRVITMENTALNGTATKDHEDWKKKKGFGPIIVAASLTFLLGLSFYAGSHIVGGNLRHGEMGTANAAASSSSTSLVGSGTAALDLKTLTIEGGGNPGATCKKTSDCVKPTGLDHPVCRDGRCQSGAAGSSCGVTSDCVKPPGLDHPVCHDGTCKSGAPGSYCGVTSDCVKPPGLDHPVCRDGRCQSGASSSSCGATSDCVVPQGLEHPVCRQGQCQRGVCFDYCGQDSDCVSGFLCTVGRSNSNYCNDISCEKRF